MVIPKTRPEKVEQPTFAVIEPLEQQFAKT